MLIIPDFGIVPEPFWAREDGYGKSGILSPAIKVIQAIYKTREWFASDDDFNAATFVQNRIGIAKAVPGLPIVPSRSLASLRYAYDVLMDEVHPASG